MENPKPCPWCLKTPDVYQPNPGKGEYWDVACTNHLCPVQPGLVELHKTREEASAVWNTQKEVAK